MAKKPARSAKRPKAPGPAERRRAVAELRVLAHPLRLRLFELFADRPRTTIEVAELLGEPPTRLYHHVNALAKAGLLRVHETRRVRGTIAKYYQSVQEPVKGTADAPARRSAATRQSLRAVAGVVFEQARQDMMACFREPGALEDPAPLLLRMVLIAPPSQAAALRKRLLRLVQELRDEFGEEDGKRKTSPNDERWAMTLAFAPSWPRRAPDGTSST